MQNRMPGAASYQEKMQHETEPSEVAPPSRASWVIRIGVPLALLAVGYAVLAAERWTLEHELQLMAPLRVRPGEPVPVRVFVYRDDEQLEAGALIAADVRVRWVRGGRVLEELAMSAGAGPSMEGVFAHAPERADGDRLEVIASEGSQVLATVECDIAVDPDAPPAEITGRLSGELQHLQMGPILGEGALPTTMEVRVEGGTCIPDGPCTLWIDLDPGLSPLIAEHPAISGLTITREGPLHRAELEVHGAEAQVQLRAMRAEAGELFEVAHRSVRLPMALATPWLAMPREHGSGRLSWRAVAPLGWSELVVDVYRRGSWVFTRTVPASAEGMEIPFDRGLVRVQIHSDPYGWEYSATRYVIVGGEPRPEALRSALAEEGIELADPADAHPWLVLAGAEEEVRHLPELVSGRQGDLEDLQARRHTLFVLGGVAAAIAIVIAIALILRRGLAAAAEARAVMAAAGEAALARQSQLRMTLTVIAMVGAVALALVAGAALVLGRAALSGW